MHKLGCRTFSSARVFGGAVLYCTEEKVIELPCPARIERERKESYAHRMVEVVVTWYWIHVGRDRDRDRGVDVERTERREEAKERKRETGNGKRETGNGKRIRLNRPAGIVIPQRHHQFPIQIMPECQHLIGNFDHNNDFPQPRVRVRARS